MIAIIDYGMGNLRSVEKAFEFLGHPARIADTWESITAASHVVLPGDAAFGDAMGNLHRDGWVEAIHRSIQVGKPFLGICVGLQVMFSESEEMGLHKGLALLPGRCVRFPATERVPQIGWNQIVIRRPNDLLREVPDESFFYFVHSYYVDVAEEGHVLATTDYGREYVSVAGHDYVFGVQFHPEKSQDCGLRLLRNFALLN